MHSIEKNLKVVNLLISDEYAAGTDNGTCVDSMGFEEMLIILNVGENAAGGTLDVKLQEGAESDGSDAADITGAAFTQITTSNDVNIYVARLNLRGRERYIRAVGVTATAACTYSVSGIMAGALSLPVSQVNSAVFSV